MSRFADNTQERSYSILESGQSVALDVKLELLHGVAGQNYFGQD
jgi:hypothetical protein